MGFDGGGGFVVFLSHRVVNSLMDKVTLCLVRLIRIGLWDTVCNGSYDKIIFI